MLRAALEGLADQSVRLVQPLEPVIEAAHNVRSPATVGVNTPRTKRSNDLAEANLLVCHNTSL